MPFGGNGNTYYHWNTKDSVNYCIKKGLDYKGLKPIEIINKARKHFNKGIYNEMKKKGLFKKGLKI